MKRLLRSLWEQPQVADPPRRVWRDWVLIAAIAVAAIVETVVRDDIVWPIASLVLCFAIAPTVLFRRTHPLFATAVAFGSVAAFDVVSLSLGAEWEGLSAYAFLLVLPYSLFRWGSGRQGVIGIGVILAPAVLGSLAHENPAGTIFGAFVIILLAAAMGAVVRYEIDLLDHRVGEARLRQREELARELHDTVAHHVSAIAVQAQAGLAVAKTRPQAAGEALEVIEEEASRTLEEMRSMIAALRDGGDPDLAPRAGVHDIERLATSTTQPPTVLVQLHGRLDDLRPSVDTAVFRLAQESITNARRHAKNARRIDVCVEGGDEHVTLTVNDDGEHSGSVNGAGFGLVGMAERTKLLGGTLRAGRERDRGWTVHAILPRDGVRA